jgi:hypothetical protein
MRARRFPARATATRTRLLEIPSTAYLCRATQSYNGRFRSLGEIEHLIKAHEARRIFPVREHDERLAAHVLLDHRPNLSKLSERHVDGVVEGRGAAGRRLPDRGFQLRLVRREWLPDLNAAVEIDDLRHVHQSEPANEIRRRGLEHRQVLLHAGATVEKQRQGKRLLAAVEERDVLFDPILEYGEVRKVEVGEVPIRSVGGNHVQRHHVDADTKGGLLRQGPWRACWRLLRERDGSEQRGDQQQYWDAIHVKTLLRVPHKTAR